MRRVTGDLQPIEDTPGFTPISGTEASSGFQDVSGTQPSSQFEEVNQVPQPAQQPQEAVSTGDTFQPQQREDAPFSIDTDRAISTSPFQDQSALIGIDSSIFEDPEEEMPEAYASLNADMWTTSVPTTQGETEYSSVMSDIMKPKEEPPVLIPQDRPERGTHPDQQRAGTDGKFIGNLYVTPKTRAQYRPEPGSLNIAMDFNASASGTARGTEVIIPEDASPAVRASAAKFNKEVAMFAKRHSITDYPIRGVRTRTQNQGRGMRHTVHAEPFFNSDEDMQKAIKQNPQEFAQIYVRAFGQLPSARLIAAHGVGRDRGAASSIFKDETSFGELMVSSLLGS